MEVTSSVLPGMGWSEWLGLEGFGKPWWTLVGCLGLADLPVLADLEGLGAAASSSSGKSISSGS